MGLDLVGLATAFVGLVAALVTLWAVWLGAHNQKVNQVTIAPPSDAKARSYIERTIWERKAPKRPAIYNGSRPPILVIANMKGGVGKTTIAANFGAHLCAAPDNNRVLLIDFD